MALAAQYGPSIATPMVERAFILLAQEWLPSYIEVVAAAMGLDAGLIQYPNSWQGTYDFERYTELNLPTFVVICSGTTGDFTRLSDGSVNGWFALEAGVIVEDTTEASTRTVAGLYQTAVAMMLEQKGELTGLTSQTLVTGLELELPVETKRTISYGRVEAETFVQAMYNRLDGPDAPSVTLSDPDTITDQGDWPTVDQLELDIAAVDNETDPADAVFGPGLTPGPNLYPGQDDPTGTDECVQVVITTETDPSSELLPGTSEPSDDNVTITPRG